MDRYKHIDYAGREHCPAGGISVQRGQGEASTDATHHLSEPEREWWQSGHAPSGSGALGLFFFISLYVQNVLHYSPSLSGLSFLPLPIIIGIISLQAPRLLNRFGFKPLLITGASLMIIGTFLLSFLTPASSYVINLLPAFLILALGMGLSFVAVTVAATSGIPDNETGLASGLINTSQQLGGALGLAVLTVVASTTTAADVASGKVIARLLCMGTRWHSCARRH